MNNANVIVLPDYDPAAETEVSSTVLDWTDISSREYLTFQQHILDVIDGLHLYHRQNESKEEYKKVEHSKLCIEIWQLFEASLRQYIVATDEDEQSTCLQDMKDNFNIIYHMAEVEGCELAKELTNELSQMRLIIEELDANGHHVFDKNTRKLLGVEDPSDNPHRVVRFAV